MGRTLIFCAIVLCLAGCMIGPDYIRPGVDAPKTFRFESEQAAKTADTDWWKQYNDPVLDQLIEGALANNKDVKIAAARVEQAAGVLMTTRSALFPQIGYGGAGSNQRQSSTAMPGPPLTNPYTNYQLFAQASWEIDLWGRIRRLTEAARANLLSTEEARRGVILSLVAQVAGAYIQLRGLDEQLVISRRTLKTYDESVKLFELQFKYGQVNQLTVEQARSQYETAAVTVPQVENQIVVTENAISILLGRNPGPIPRGRPLLDLNAPPIPAGLPSELLERRPDILQAEQNLIAANAQIGAAKALYFPTISLTGMAGKASEQLSDLFNGPSGVWNYGGSIIGPIFTAGNIAGQVAQAEAGQKAALLAYQQTIQQAFADTENALSSNQRLSEQLVAEKKRVDAYKEYARLARLQYTEGYAPYLNVLYAETQLFPSELSAVQTRAATLISVATVYKAMGGGWVMEADKLTGQGTNGNK